MNARIDNQPGPPPVVLASAHSGGSADYTLAVQPDCAFFSGHFPGHPVLPGVAQVRWAVTLAAALTGGRAVIGLERIKFARAITPGTAVRLSLQLSGDAGAVSFRYHDGTTSLSSGRLLLEERDD